MSIEQRIENLERSNRLLRTACIVLGALCGLPFVLGQVPQHQNFNANVVNGGIIDAQTLNAGTANAGTLHAKAATFDVSATVRARQLTTEAISTTNVDAQTVNASGKLSAPQIHLPANGRDDVQLFAEPNNLSVKVQVRNPQNGHITTLELTAEGEFYVWKGNKRWVVSTSPAASQ